VHAEATPELQREAASDLCREQRCDVDDRRTSLTLGQHREHPDDDWQRYALDAAFQAAAHARPPFVA
jgi:hypothetical protein